MSAFRNRDVHLLVGAAGLSALGDLALAIPLALEVRAKTGSALAVSLFFLCMFGPIVLLAGVSIFGGKGSLAGVVLAVLPFAGIQNALLLTNFNQEATGIVTGALLLASVFLPTVFGPAVGRWLRRLSHT